MKRTVGGFFDTKYGRPFVRAAIKDTKRSFRENIYFMISTGSPDTFISYRDIKEMGLHLEDLEEQETQQFGEVSSTHILKEPTIVFETDNGETIELDLDKITVIKGKSKEIDIVMPSILGRNILYKFSLLINKNEDDISLTYDDTPAPKFFGR